jgi:hypothetical protein
LLTNTYTPIADYPTLNVSGPYLLSNRILLNPDGSGIKMIDYPEEFALGEYSPDGEWRILYIGGLVGDIYTGACVNCEPWTDMSLWLMHIPDGNIIKIADITTYTIMYEKHNWGECISLLGNQKTARCCLSLKGASPPCHNVLPVDGLISGRCSVGICAFGIILGLV